LGKALETGHFLKGVLNWSVWERCLKLVRFRKVLGTGYFVQGVWQWSVWERRLELISFLMAI
jgi:hypothetical protein